MPRSFILPGQPTRYARDTTFKIEHLKLELEPFFESKRIVAKATYKIKPVVAPLSSIKLDAGDLEFKSVIVDGKKANYETESTKLKIVLDHELQSDSPAIVEIEYEASPKRGLYFRGPTSNYPNRFVHLFTQGQAEDSKYWYPCYDYPNMRFSSETLVTAPEKLVVISNGKLLSNEAKGPKRLWHFSQEIPHSSYLLSIIVGDYEKLSLIHDGISVEYYVPRERVDCAKRSFEKTPKMLDFFAKVTGVKYPYPKYSQTVVSDFMFGGMENITATTLTEKTLHDERAHLDFQSENLVSHELAHQWFGDYLTCRDWSHAWLNEGFATYFNALFRESDLGWDDFQYSMQLNYEKLVDDIDERYHRQIVEKRYWDPEELFDSHTYEKGSWVLNGIRGLIGDDLFWRVIKTYIQEHKLQNVETSDFRKTLEQVSGLDFEKFFQEWLYSPGFPDYEVLYSFNDSTSQVRLEVEQKNAGVDGVPLFTGPIEIELSFADGKREKHLISLTEKKCAFFFSVSERPKNVSFDPKNWILKKLKFRKPKEMLLSQLSSDANSMERIRAAQELSEYKTQDVIDALGRAMEEDKFWAVRLESGKYLGKIGSGEALDALLSKKDHEDHRVRRGIARGLQYFSNLKDNDRAIDQLIEYLKNDESYYVRAYAAFSLGFFRLSKKAFEALSDSIKQDSINDQIRYRAFLGFAEMKDPKALPIAEDYLVNGKEYQGRSAAAFAIGKLGKGSMQALRTLLYMKDIEELRVRAEAASAIANIGDPSVTQDLESWLSQENEGSVRRRLRETIYRLKK